MTEDSRSPNDVQDELDVLSVQSGDVEAFRGLVDRWQRNLVGYAGRLTDDPEGALDVVQEAWLSAAKGIGRLRDPAGFRPWIYRIVQRRAADWVRGRVREHKVEQVARETLPTGGQDAGIEILREAIAMLPEDQRHLLQLHYTDGLRVREISQVLGVPVGTVKSRLFHAREILRATLNPNQ